MRYFFIGRRPLLGGVPRYVRTFCPLATASISIGLAFGLRVGLAFGLRVGLLVDFASGFVSGSHRPCPCRRRRVALVGIRLCGGPLF